MRIDLHTHSSASDGQYSPTELIDIACGERIELLALTDHDTVDGISDASMAAGKSGIAFVPGIEISTQDIVEIHILGYGIDVTNQALLCACKEWRNARVNRGKLIKKYLNTKGISIDLAEVMTYARGQSLGRPHFAQYLQAYGIVKTRKEAFDKYLDTEEFKIATDRRKPSLQMAVELIHGAGGKALLAHPGIYRLTEEELDDLVFRLVEMGIDGVECFYSRHGKTQTEKYLSYIKKYELKTGCGSDFHGEKVKPEIGIGMEFDDRKYGSHLIVDGKGELR